MINCETSLFGTVNYITICFLFAFIDIATIRNSAEYLPDWLCQLDIFVGCYICCIFFKN